MAKISVALSGGGNRASLFGLGVLLYLHDAERNKQVTSISSVSGGSFTNGYLAQAGNFRDMTKNDFTEVATAFASQLANRGTLFAALTTRIYLAIAIVSLLASPALFLLPWALWTRWLAFFGVLFLWIWLIAGKRGAVCAKAFASTMYSPTGKPTLLSQTARDELDHVFCSTDLHIGEHVYFSGRFVYSYRLGWGQPADLPLYKVVQASAAFPGGFPAAWLPTARHRFQDGRNSATYMTLSDGGVYDNMGEEWALGLPSRKSRPAPSRPELCDADELIVVNASGDMKWQSTTALGIPVLSELTTMVRVINVMYDNTTAPRRRMLIDIFKESERLGHGLRGSLVTIDQTPFRVPKAFAKSQDEPDRAKRAQAVLDLLGPDQEDRWNQIAKDNTDVATTMAKLGPDVSAKLIYQGYVVAMANLHVLLDYPLLALPSQDTFTPLCSRYL